MDDLRASVHCSSQAEGKQKCKLEEVTVRVYYDSGSLRPPMGFRAVLPALRAANMAFVLSQADLIMVEYAA